MLKLNFSNENFFHNKCRNHISMQAASCHPMYTLLVTRKKKRWKKKQETRGGRGREAGKRHLLLLYLLKISVLSRDLILTKQPMVSLPITKNLPQFLGQLRDTIRATWTRHFQRVQEGKGYLWEMKFTILWQTFPHIMWALMSLMTTS